MSSVNKAIIVGNLGADPEVRSFQNGNKVANLRIATSESWKDKQTGEKQERTEWHSISIFSEGLVGVAERFLHKGSKVYVEGKIQTRKWQDKDGNDRYSTEIVLQGYDAKLVMLDGPRNDGGSQQQNRSQQHQSDPYAGEARRPAREELDDDIPFDGGW